jgi:hypothetical protein
MKGLRYTLVSDGPTDANLIPILNWSLKQTGGVALPEGRHAEFWRLPCPPKDLAERLTRAVELYPCEVLFVHRDAENQPVESRAAEITKAFQAVAGRLGQPAVAVVPVRMLEAWLCFDEKAIRNAAGNPNGKAPLNLPSLKRVESRPDPKQELQQALRAACELSGRRLKKFDTAAAFWRIVDCIDDFSPLRELAAFRALEDSVQKLKKNDWKSGLYV